MDSRRASNVVVPAAVDKNAWVAVNIANSNRDVDSLQNSMNRIAFQYSRPFSIEKPEKKKSSRLSLCSELWKRFARTTTGHGFARMVDREEPKSMRIFWVTVIVLLISGLLTSIIIISYESLVVRGLRREFIVQHNTTMFLPDIHICDTSLFNRAILQGSPQAFFYCYTCGDGSCLLKEKFHIPVWQNERKYISIYIGYSIMCTTFPHILVSCLCRSMHSDNCN